jgi:putative phosphoribosyl transferase
MVFRNRAEAGKLLGAKIETCLPARRGYRDIKNLVVLGIPRGGIVVGRELAEILGCPLDVVVTKKIGAPGHEELAIGAVGATGEPVIDEQLAEKTGADENYLKTQISKLKSEIVRREELFRQNKTPLALKDRVVILTDDGVATGATMLAALGVIRQQTPKKIIVAVPVIAKDSLEKIEALSDEVIYLDAPALFFAVGQFYNEFEQVSDEEVSKILATSD